jgi:hypothetical protein
LFAPRLNFVHFPLDQGFTPVQTVPNPQNVGLGTALELVDETLKGIEGPDLVVGNTIAAHGFLQNGLTIAISN